MRIITRIIFCVPLTAAPFLACSSSSGGSIATDASAASADAATTHPADATTLVHADACQKAGAVCAVSGTCAKAGGALAATSGAGGCTLDTGTAECCIPPKPVSDPLECNGQGGVCTTFAACDETHGYHSSDTSCGGAGFVCCVPHASCGDAPFSCCAQPGEVYAPSCNAGELQCPPQTTQCASPTDH